MNESYKAALEQLHKDYPLPKQALTLNQLCDVLPLTLKTLQNHLSKGGCGFPVISVGGRVLVSKVTVAKMLAGIDPNVE